MGLKEFFKPNKHKIIILIILLVFISFVNAIYMESCWWEFQNWFRWDQASAGYCPPCAFILLIPQMLPLVIGLYYLVPSIVSILCYYLLTCIIHFLGRKFLKKCFYLTYIIIILLILIITASFVFYPPKCFGCLTAKQIQITNAFCTGGNTANVLVRNTGTLNVIVSDIEIIDTSTNTSIENPKWTTIDGSQVITELDPGKTGKFSTACTGYCTYKFIYEGDIRITQSISVQC